MLAIQNSSYVSTFKFAGCPPKESARQINILISPAELLFHLRIFLAILCRGFKLGGKVVATEILPA
jgi:hypothetical protein